jgi:hypothetical protein
LDGGAPLASLEHDMLPTFFTALLSFAVFLLGPPPDKASVISFLRGHTSPASVNSCSNVVVMGVPYDESGLTDNEYWLQAAGTFRIAGEEDEHQQPMFNLNVISCEKHPNDQNASLECQVTTASVSADSGKPDTDDPNCLLDLSFSKISNEGASERHSYGDRDFHWLLQHDPNDRSEYETGIFVVHENNIRRQLR